MKLTQVAGLAIGGFFAFAFLNFPGSTHAGWFGPQTMFDETFEVGASKNRVLAFTLTAQGEIDANVTVTEGDSILIAFSQNPMDNFPQSVSFIPGLIEKSTLKKQFKGTLPAGKYWVGIATTGHESGARAVVNFKMTVE